MVRNRYRDYLLAYNHWDVICLGIQNCLFEKCINIPSDIDWNTVFQESQKHAITGIAYRGLKRFMSNDTAYAWRHVQYLNTYYFIKNIDEQQKMAGLLNQYYIPFTILKGTAAAIYYPVPELRAMGDIDFFVSPSLLKKAKKVLVSNQYHFSEIDSNDRHLTFFKNNIRYEMHFRFSNEPDRYDIDPFIMSCMNKLSTGTIFNRSFPMLPPMENGLVLLLHVRQHLLGGIGVRQIIDWMMYVNSVLNDEYWETVFEHHVQKLGLKKLAIHITKMCQMYLGLSSSFTWCTDADELICNHLMYNIIHSGNFGVNYGGGKIVEKTFTTLKRRGFLNYLQEAGEFNWKAYHEHRFLKPFAWVYQICRYFRQGVSHRNIIALLDDYSRSRERYRLLKDLDCL